MYTYSIFSVKPEIATHYIYKTGILYRFLKEYKERPNRKYLQLQYNYCIQPLYLNLVANYLENLDIDLQIEERDKHLKIYWEEKRLTLFEDSRHLEIACDSIEEIEEFFFPVLRKSPEFIFVISNRMKDYGWLSIKNERMINNQILYSFS